MWVKVRPASWARDPQAAVLRRPPRSDVRLTPESIGRLCRIRVEVCRSGVFVQVSALRASGCKSVAKATKVRILHLPPSVMKRGPDLRKRRSGPLLRQFRRLARDAASGQLRRDFDTASEVPRSGGARRSRDAWQRQRLSVPNTRQSARRPRCLCRSRVWQRRTEVRRDRKAVRHCAGDALSWAKAPGSRRSDRGSGATPVGRRVGQSARPR